MSSEHKTTQDLDDWARRHTLYPTFEELIERELDAYTRRHTVFPGFKALVEVEGFRPSLKMRGHLLGIDDSKCQVLADAYDGYMKVIGDDRRVYRYDNPKTREERAYLRREADKVGRDREGVLS